jgi:biotin-[acetyl-CoA-carboxylase] ligase BirA-like protein
MEDIYDKVLRKRFRVPVFFKEETGSTSADAIKMLKAGENPPFVVLARMQSAAYGKMGSHWVGNVVGNLYLSHALAKTQQLGRHPDLLVRHVATKICDVLGANFSINAWVKLPNDVFVASKKVGGLLLEIARNGDSVAAAVLGIGINVLVAPAIGNAGYLAACLQDFSADGLDFADVAIAVVESSLDAISSFYLAKAHEGKEKKEVDGKMVRNFF